MAVVKRSVAIDAEVAEVRKGLQGVAEWEGESGALTAEERAAGEALLERILRGPKRVTLEIHSV